MKTIQNHILHPYFHADEGSCGCGHDHHDHEHEHHHDEDCSCGCGHDHHDHEHEHHHDEDCGCGHDHHDHEHEHHHDDDCGCGCGQDHHDHEHEHPHDEGSPAKAVFLLENLGCANCAAKMEEKINTLPGVESDVITFATKQLRLNAEDPETLLPQIQKICSSIESQVIVKPKETTQKSDTNAAVHHTSTSSAKKEEHAEMLELTGLILGTLFFITGLVSERMGLQSNFVFAVYIASYVVLGGSVLLEAGKNIAHGQIFDENFLMGIATLAAFAIGDYPEAVGVMLFYRVGEFFEHKAVERSRGQIMDAIDMRPETVNLVTDTGIRVIPAEEAAVGDILLIRPGDRIPLDGTVTEGSSRIDTSPITGEPVPVSAGVGSDVTSGCVNTSGQLKIRVVKPLSESMVTRILDSVENAAASKPKIDRFITKFARIYTPCVVFAAIAIAVIPSLVTSNWHYWVYTAITFLVMSCPCALVLSVPLAFFSGIGAGSKKGILFKGGVSMEALHNVKAIVMDKTGTITEGNFRLQKAVPMEEISEADLLRICASCEQNSTHPIAHSIVTAAKEQGIQLSDPSSLEEIAGYGISAKMAEGDVLCGNQKLMDRYGVKVPNIPNDNYGAEVFLAVNGTFAGYLIISDTLKPDAKSAISRLKSLGLYTVMLTGDSKANAEAVAGEVGMDEVHAKLLPQDKLNILTEVRSKQGAVMFVGDGINDAPVLAGADVGAAMGSGADAAIEAADTVFMNSNVSSIPAAISIARSTNRIAVQNVVFALAIKLCVMVLGILGFANMWMAVFADSGVAMLCVLNSIRVLYKKS